MADFIHAQTLGESHVLVNTDNILSVFDRGDFREITLAEYSEDGLNMTLETPDTMEQLIEKLRNPLVRPGVVQVPWGKPA
jgi:hypothetical protein